MLLALHQDWQDVLLWILGVVMIGAGLLVVTMRDIIRCGLAMIVCFLALAGIYVLMGVPLLGAAQVIVYIGAISVLILFAIMLTQTKDAPTRLVFQTQAGPASIAAVIVAIVIALAVTATEWGEVARHARLATERLRGSCSTSTSPVRDRQRAAARRRDRRRVPGQARTRRSVVSNSLDTYLVLSGPVRDRLLRVPGSAQRDQHADVDRADAQRRQPRDRRVRRVRTRRRGGPGAVIALMVMAVAAAEATVGLSIVIAIYRNRRTPLVDEYDSMRQ